MTSTGVLSRARCSRDGCSVATGAYLLTSRARKFEKGETKGCRANIRCTFPALRGRWLSFSMYEDFWRALGGTSRPKRIRRASAVRVGVAAPHAPACSDLLTGRRGRLPLAGGAADLLCAAAGTERPPQLEGASTVAAMLCTAAAAWSLAGGTASPSTSRPPPTAAPAARLAMSGSGRTSA